MRLVITLAIVALVAACTPATPEPIDAAHLAGRWELTSAGETEWLDIDAAGTFTGTIQSDGFLAQTLSQDPRATLAGAWVLEDRTITLTIETSSDDGLVGQVKTYEIEALTDRTMNTKGPSGTRHELIKGM
jgi:hypothetical protein